MTAKNFEAAYARIRVYEGGNDDDPRDPGGRTSRGITQRVYDAYRRALRQPSRDVWSASDDEVKDIYRRQYWHAVRADELPDGIDLFVFDSAVNSGPAQAIRWLQRACRIEGDKHLGEVAMMTIADHPDHDAVIADMAGRRLAMLKQLKHWSIYKNGWTKRIANCKAAGQALASGSVGPQPLPVDKLGGHKKAPPSQMAKPTVKPGEAASGATVTGTAAGIVETTQDKLQPFADVIDVVQYILLALMAIGIALTLYGIYRSWRVERAKEGEDVEYVPEDIAPLVPEPDDLPSVRTAHWGDNTRLAGLAGSERE